MQTKRQHLAMELRRLRDQAGVSGRELAQRVGISQSKVSRIESGAAIPTAPEVEAWADALQLPQETRRLLSALMEAAFTEVHTWRTALRGRVHLQDDIQELERMARTIYTFQPSVIPGLLQTAEYARRMFTISHLPYAESDIPVVLAGRLDRQLAIYDEGRRFEFLITEAALRWRPGPPRLLVAQLDRVASLSTLENVTIGLIPHAVEALTPTTHAFVVFESPDDEGGVDAVVTVETIHAGLTVNDADNVDIYRTRWALLRQMAVFDDEARDFLARLAVEYRTAET